MAAIAWPSRRTGVFSTAGLPYYYWIWQHHPRRWLEVLVDLGLELCFDWATVVPYRVGVDNRIRGD